MDFLVDFGRQLMQQLHEVQGWYKVLAFIGIVIALEWSYRRLKRVVGRLDQRVEQLQRMVEEHSQTLGQRIAAVQNIAEQAAVDMSSPASAESWEHIRRVWGDARDRMEVAIGDIADDKVRRQYSKLPRSDYAEIISYLQQDGLISTDAAKALLALNEKFLALKRARVARPEDAQEFKQLHSIADKALPKLPDE